MEASVPITLFQPPQSGKLVSRSRPATPDGNQKETDAKAACCYFYALTMQRLWQQVPELTPTEQALLEYQTKEQEELLTQQLRRTKFMGRHT